MPRDVPGPVKRPFGVKKNRRKAGGKPFEKGCKPGPGRPKGVRNKFAEELKQVILDANSVYAVTAIARAYSDDFLLDRGTIFCFHFGPAKYQVVSARKI